jgi:hypothetical protein
MDKLSKLIHSNDAEEIISTLKKTHKKTPLWHPLGFISLEVAKCDGFELTLHYWPKTSTKQYLNHQAVHSHNCHLHSRVIAGSIQNNVYKIEAGNTHRLYSVEYYGKNSQLRPTKMRVNMQLESSQVYQSGKTYKVPLNQFHHINVSHQQSTLTLVMQYGFEDKPPLVVGGENTSLKTYKRIDFDELQFWEEVAECL